MAAFAGGSRAADARCRRGDAGTGPVCAVAKQGENPIAMRVSGRWLGLDGRRGQQRGQNGDTGTVGNIYDCFLSCIDGLQIQ